MASSINASTSSGLVQTGDTSGVLQLQTNSGQTAVTIDTSQNVGIGTSSPSNFGKFAVVGASSGGQVVGAIVNTSGTANTQAVLSLNTVNDLFNVRDSQIRATNNGSNQTTLEFYTANAATPTEKMRIDNVGNVGIGTTNLTTGSSSGAVFVAANSSFYITGQTSSAQLGLGNYNNGVNATNGTLCGSLAFRTYFNSTFSGGSDIASINGVYTGNGTTRTGGIAFYTINAGAESEKMRIDSSGNVLVGTTDSSETSGAGVKFIPFTGSANYGIKIVSALTSNSYVTNTMYSTGASAYRFYVGWGGTISATSTTITGISDQRLKENIKDLDDGLDAVMSLKPRKFDWKEGKGKDIKGDRGFIAQEFETVFPDMIEEWKDPAPEGEEPYKAVNANLIPVLVKAIQEQQTIINDLKARITALEGAK